MSKRRKSLDPQPDIKLIVVKEIFDLLAAGKINQLLTWKKMDKKPNIIDVGMSDSDDFITVRCKLMDTVGFGYVPNGYPEHLKATGKTTRFHIEPLHEEEASTTPSPDSESATLKPTE